MSVEFLSERIHRLEETVAAHKAMMHVIVETRDKYKGAGDMLRANIISSLIEKMHRHAKKQNAKKEIPAQAGDS